MEEAAASGSLTLAALQEAITQHDLPAIEHLLFPPVGFPPLLPASVDLNSLSVSGHTPLALACSRGDPLMVALLLRHPEVNVNARGAEGLLPLVEA